MWRVAETVVLRERPSRRQIESEIWEEMALALIFPRHIPEWIDDQTISDWIWRTIANEKLPWEVSDEDVEQMCHGHSTEL